MNIPRRFLPSLPALSAFEAASRTGSVTSAAKELNLTQSAVSRQIKALEAQLEISLFRRERQTIQLTAAGHAYAREVRAALMRIGAASLNLRANPSGGTLNVATLPTFGSHWLVPRIGAFLNRHPNIVVNIVTRMTQFDFRSEAIDAAIHFGENNWAAAESALLMGETVVPACSKALKKRFAFKQPKDLRNAPLLHLTDRPDAWEKWLSKYSVDANAVHGMLFDNHAAAAAAAMTDLGVALLPRFLFGAEFDEGRLVMAMDRPLEMQSHYYLVWPRDRTTYPPLSMFRKWLVATATSEP